MSYTIEPPRRPSVYLSEPLKERAFDFRRVALLAVYGCAMVLGYFWFVNKSCDILAVFNGPAAEGLRSLLH